MHDSEPSFSLNISNDVLWVVLEGQWNVATDLSYLTELSDNMRQIRNQPWGLVVDMRNWYIDSVEQTFAAPNSVSIDLDRRNQVLECWLVRENSQADFLVGTVTNQPKIEFVKSKSLDALLTHCKKHHLDSSLPPGITVNS